MGFSRRPAAAVSTVLLVGIVLGAQILTNQPGVPVAETLSVHASSDVWVRLSPSGSAPPARSGHSALYDGIGKRMFLFGGDTGSSKLGDSWELPLSGSGAWTSIATAGGAPAARTGHTAILDSADSANMRLLVFGGSGTGDVLDDLWALQLSGGTATWSQLTPLFSAPAARSGHTAIYDTSDGASPRMVVFGGRGRSGVLNDTWALSLSGLSAWFEISASGSPPPARSGHSAIFDSAGQRMVVFGGITGATVLNDVWTLALGNSLTWTHLTPSGTAPPGRSAHSAIYDAANNRMVVFGGTSGSSQLGDVWALSLGASPAWSQLGPGGGTPQVRSGHSAVYDSNGQQMIVFGGLSSSGHLNDVWALGAAAVATPTSTPTQTAPTPTSTPSNLSPRAFGPIILDTFGPRT